MNTKMYATDIKQQSIDLTLSVNPLGCSPRAQAALKKLRPQDVSTYPKNDELITAIAKKFQIPEDQIVLGNGSEQLIKLIVQTFVNPGDEVRIPFGSFSLFSKESELRSARVILSTLDDMTQAKPRLAFIANPGTPTGETVHLSTLQNIITSVTPGIVVIDEANGEFSPTSTMLTTPLPSNVIVLRTFSKVLGLAGVRVAFATARPPLIQKLQNAQQPFPISSLAITLALATITDEQFTQKTIDFIAKERSFLMQKLNHLGIQTSQSVTNNLFIKTRQADVVVKQLNKRGVSVIPGSYFPGMQESGFRIAIKKRKTNRIFLEKLTEALACINKKTLLPSEEVFI